MSILNDHLRPDLRPELHNNAKLLHHATNIHHDMDLTNLTNLTNLSTTKLHHTNLHHDMDLSTTKLHHSSLHHDMELPNTKLHPTNLHHSNMDLPMTSAHDPTASCSPLSSSTDSKTSFIFTQEQVECVCEVSVKAINVIPSLARKNPTYYDSFIKKRNKKKNMNRFVWFPHGISFCRLSRFVSLSFPFDVM